jgi:mono/diheme cytochrome c family protein
VWRENNCQACHQLYGFGGFLGPDLTNRIDEATPDTEISWILRDGSNSMPALRLPPEDQRSVIAFLRVVSRTGRSQPPRLEGRQVVAPAEQLDWLADAWTRETGGVLAAPVSRGRQVWQESRCGTCHLQFVEGRNLAPDVSVRALDVTPAALRTLLGQGQRRMPAFPLGHTQTDDLSEFLSWVSANRSHLVDLNRRLTDAPRFAWQALPWFEYQ